MILGLSMVRYSIIKISPADSASRCAHYMYLYDDVFRREDQPCAILNELHSRIGGSRMKHGSWRTHFDTHRRTHHDMDVR